MSAIRAEIIQFPSNFAYSDRNEDLTIESDESIPLPAIGNEISIRRDEAVFLENKRNNIHQNTADYLEDPVRYQFENAVIGENSAHIRPIPNADQISSYVTDIVRLDQVRAELKQLQDGYCEIPDTTVLVHEFYKYGKDGKIEKDDHDNPEIEALNVYVNGEPHMMKVYDTWEFMDVDNTIKGKMWYVSGETMDGRENPIGMPHQIGKQEGERVVFGQVNLQDYNSMMPGDSVFTLLHQPNGSVAQERPNESI